MMRTEKEYLQYLKDKRVIIVGLAGYLQGQGKGSYIDSFDCVIRMNSGYPVTHPADYGKKTNVLYRYIGRENVNDLEKTRQQASGFDWLVVHTDTVVEKKKDQYAKEYLSAVNTVWTNLDFIRMIKSFIDRTPNIGTVALIQILQSLAKSIETIGCDFYASGAFKDYYKGNNGKAVKNAQAHDNRSQVELWRFIKDKRLTLNKEILEWGK